MAVPVVATSKEERDVICAQKPIRSNIALALSADVSFVGIGELNDAPPLLTDGFITRKELHELQAAGAAGEIIGWSFNDLGHLVNGLTNDRVASVPLDPAASRGSDHRRRPRAATSCGPSGGRSPAENGCQRADHRRNHGRDSDGLAFSRHGFGISLCFSI